MNEKEDWAAQCRHCRPLFKWQNHFTRKFIICHGHSRKGSVRDGNTVGDSATEARDRHMSVEVTSASTEYGGIRHVSRLFWLGGVCPRNLQRLMGVDAAVVVCEPTSDASGG